VLGANYKFPYCVFFPNYLFFHSTCIHFTQISSTISNIPKFSLIPLKIPGEFKIYRVSREQCAGLREGVPYVKVCRYNPKHLCPKLNGYGDNGQRNLKL
jgi:hypothetical protein